MGRFSVTLTKALVTDPVVLTAHKILSYMFVTLMLHLGHSNP